LQSFRRNQLVQTFFNKIFLKSDFDRNMPCPVKGAEKTTNKDARDEK
jgi:hypothetical protein